MKPWTKREAKEVRSAILSAWLEVRPTFPNYLDDHAGLRKRFLEKLEKLGRKEAAAYGLSILAGRHAHYVRLHEEGAKAWRENLKNEEIALRCDANAAEHRKKLEAVRALMAKLVALGVPEELRDFDPTAAAPAG